MTSPETGRDGAASRATSGTTGTGAAADTGVRAVVFDLDGVLVDSERLWDEVRRSVVAAHGGHWREEATRALQGMSTPEWSRYLVDELGVALPADEVANVVIAEMVRRYESAPPVLAGAERVVRTIAATYPTAIASSSPPVLIKAFLTATGTADLIGAAVSSEQVAAGKPAPDVYLEAAARIGTAPKACAAVEDSTNGLRSALAAGMRVVGVPNPHYPPDPEVLALATEVLDRIEDLPTVLGLSR